MRAEVVPSCSGSRLFRLVGDSTEMDRMGLWMMMAVAVVPSCSLSRFFRPLLGSSGKDRMGLWMMVVVVVVLVMMDCMRLVMARVNRAVVSRNDSMVGFHMDLAIDSTVARRRLLEMTLIVLVNCSCMGSVMDWMVARRMGSEMGLIVEPLTAQLPSLLDLPLTQKPSPKPPSKKVASKPLPKQLPKQLPKSSPKPSPEKAPFILPVSGKQGAPGKNNQPSGEPSWNEMQSKSGSSHDARLLQRR